MPVSFWVVIPDPKRPMVLNSMKEVRMKTGFQAKSHEGNQVKSLTKVGKGVENRARVSNPNFLEFRNCCCWTRCRFFLKKTVFSKCKKNWDVIQNRFLEDGIGNISISIQEITNKKVTRFHVNGRTWEGLSSKIVLRKSKSCTARSWKISPVDDSDLYLKKKLFQYVLIGGWMS